MSFKPCLLPERAVLSVRGAEAAAFLHSLLTCDVLGMGPIAYGALLTPQGKILSDMFLVKQEDGFLIDCAASQADELVKKLVLYRLRTKLAITHEMALGVRVSPNEGLADPRWPAMGGRMIGPAAPSGLSASYHAHRIREGLADSDADLGAGEIFPHEANLDQFNGVSFTKGCYVGQEVVSRMEHRGTARSRILPVEFAASACAKGTAITAAGRSVGTVLSSSGKHALALLRLDRLEEAHAAGEALSSAGELLAVRTPKWARFHVPQPRAA